MEVLAGVILALVKSGLGIANNLTNGKNKKLLLDVHEQKKLIEKVEIARIIFDGRPDTKLFGDNSFPGTDRLMASNCSEDIDGYNKLRSMYNEC